MFMLGKVLFGSQNYDLDGSNSDKDYKILLSPTYEEMYKNHKVDKNDLDSTYNSEYYSVIDCRNFDNLLHICNPNILEMVFSIEWQVYDNSFAVYHKKAKNLFTFTNYIALHWKEFFSATQGLCFNSLSRYGNNPKAVSRGWYLLNLVQNVSLNEYKMDEKTWRNNNYNLWARSIRFGNLSQEELDSLAKQIKNYFSDYKEMSILRANQWCKDNSDKVKRAKEEAEELSNFMKYEIVYRLITRGSV